MSGDSEIRIQEYATLREELLQNKKFVFERPLLIITAAGVAAVQLSDKPTVLLLPVLLITTLLINLWFTVNRLRSMARIAAYIAVVLEAAPHLWIGWENALRKQRIWRKSHFRKIRKDILAKHLEDDAVSDSMNFYWILFLLHAATVLIAFSASSIALSDIDSATAISSFAATSVAACVFIGLCVGPCNPMKMKDLIEIQRAIWIESLGIKTEIKNDERVNPGNNLENL